jgi:hypothetical protein
MTRVPRAKVWLMALLLLLPVASTGAQEGEGIFTRNPLDEIRDELIKVLENASLPFTAEQEKAIAFVLEESRRASEQMFGDIMDFRNGPPQGEDRDRALAGIAWMNEDWKFH